MRWPVPALLTWAAAWLLFAGLRAAHAPLAAALCCAAGLGVLAGGRFGQTRWRRSFIAGGFPLSLGVSLALSESRADVPAWTWLLPLGALAALYPVRSWGDAPLFPTPAGALRGLQQLAPLPAGARVLDAGCGLGDGLRELHRAYPAAALTGIEWSWPLRIACGWRCRLARVPARVRQGDIWAADWSGFELVYLFQRPDSMSRALRKAAGELEPGAWLASLEFGVPGRMAEAVHRCADGRPVWLYRMPPRATAAAAPAPRNAGRPS